jgi:hypothetical protein
MMSPYRPYNYENPIADFVAIDQLEHRGLNGRKVWNKTMSDISVFATGNWPRRTEQFVGRMNGKPRVNCGLQLSGGGGMAGFVV